MGSLTILIYNICLSSISISNGQIFNERSRSTLSNVIAVFQNIGPKICEKRCIVHSDCEAISFKRRSLYCELIKDISSAQFVEDKNFEFFNLTDFKLNNDVCWPNPCFQGQKCVNSKSMNRVCINVDSSLTQDKIDIIIVERQLQNIARGKPTSQYPYDEMLMSGLYKSKYAIDGNRDTFTETNPFNETIHNENPYWMIDLLHDVLVKKIIITTRVDCCGERMQDLDITVGLTTTQLRFCAHFTGPGYNGQDIEILCDNVLLGRFIKLVLTKPYAMSMLNIAEVSIFACV